MFAAFERPGGLPCPAPSLGYRACTRSAVPSRTPSDPTTAAENSKPSSRCSPALPRSCSRCCPASRSAPPGWSHGRLWLVFLDRVQEAEDVPAVFEQVRQEKAAASRKRLRTLIQRDDLPVSLTSLPDGLTLSRGRLEVRFESLEELAQTLFWVARVLGEDTEGFAEQDEPVLPKSKKPEDEGVEELFRELLVLERDFEGSRLAKSVGE